MYSPGPLSASRVEPPPSSPPKSSSSSSEGPPQAGAGSAAAALGGPRSKDRAIFRKIVASQRTASVAGVDTQDMIWNEMRKDAEMECRKVGVMTWQAPPYDVYDQVTIRMLAAPRFKSRVRARTGRFVESDTWQAGSQAAGI